MTVKRMDANTLSIIGTVVGTGLAVSILILRNTARLDADRRAFEANADVDRRAADARADADRRAHQAAMDAFRADMREIAERTTRVEAPPPGRSASAD